MRSVGLDLGVREISFCEVSQGKVVGRLTVRGLSALKDQLGSDCAPARVAIEACREAWHVHDTLRAWGNEVLIVDTTRARRLGIGEHGRKNDRIDAECYARAVERGAIPRAHLLSPARRILREKLAMRRALVETRAQYVTTIRGIGRARGEELPRCDTDNFARKLRSAELSAEMRAAVAPLEALLDRLDEQIAVADVELDKIVEQEPATARLMTVPGVGTIVAAAFVAAIDEAGRFSSAHQLESYLGLVPCEQTTGGRDHRRLGAITKNGNRYARTMLIEAAWGMLRRRGDEPLRRWARAVVDRRGSRIGAVALARRLAGLLWAIWRDGTVYDPERVGAAIARGIAQQAQSLELQAAAIKRAAHKTRVRARQSARRLPNTPKEATV